MVADLRIDLNADLGEAFGVWSMGDDAAMLAQVSSANIACGFHAGDPQSMRTTAGNAASAGVAIGAHVAYRDLAGFGRRFVDAHPDELSADVYYQLCALDGMARAAGEQVRYVKPHGALYHACHDHRPHADAVVEAMTLFAEATGRRLPLLLAPGALAHDLAAERGFATPKEVFADRGYNPDGTLVSRRAPGAVITDVPIVVEAMQRFVEEGTIIAIDGTVISMEAESICLHGDTPGAVAMAESVRAALAGTGANIVSFA